MRTNSKQIPNSEIRAGMVLVGRHGGVVAEGDAEDSCVVVGCVAVDTEVGTLYLDADLTTRVMAGAETQVSGLGDSASIRGGIVEDADEVDPELVGVVHHSGDDYEAAVDAANAEGGSIDAVIAHLSRWDKDTENDGAPVVNGRARLHEIRRWRHQLHEGEHEELHYWLVLDHTLRFYSLYRRPLD